MTHEEMKEWINGADYEQLLLRWRDSSRDDPFFHNEIGDYYFKKIIDKREEVGEAEHKRVFDLLAWKGAQK